MNKWIDYEDLQHDIVPYTGNQRHNTITPIARKKNDMYEIDLVLRNNRTTEDYPDGIFHPHREYHHIKIENIGLIEVMGLAILPGRLKTEIEGLKECLMNRKNIDELKSLQKHRVWYEELKSLNVQEKQLDQLFENELTRIFVSVLENAGVFKMTEDGISGFKKFVNTLK